jgi:hypothetical protein
MESKILLRKYEIYYKNWSPSKNFKSW